METTKGFSPLKWLLVAIVAGVWLMLGFIAGARHERGEFLFLKSPAERAAPVAGEVWEWAEGSQSSATRYGPWPRRDFELGNLILDVRDGWVRFNSCWLYESQTTTHNVNCGGYSADRRMPLAEFMLIYRREVPGLQTLEPGVTYCKSSNGSVRRLQKDEVCR